MRDGSHDADVPTRTHIVRYWLALAFGQLLLDHHTYPPRLTGEWFTCVFSHI
jgi:hypothetical protein